MLLEDSLVFMCSKQLGKKRKSEKVKLTCSEINMAYSRRFTGGSSSFRRL